MKGVMIDAKIKDTVLEVLVIDVPTTRTWGDANFFATANASKLESIILEAVREMLEDQYNQIRDAAISESPSSIPRFF